MTNRTVLFDKHVESGAKMVDFHGWEMPIHYGSQIEEHHVVRQDAGMFDVSHMTIVDVQGDDGFEVERLNQQQYDEIFGTEETEEEESNTFREFLRKKLKNAYVEWRKSKDPKLNTDNFLWYVHPNTSQQLWIPL